MEDIQGDADALGDLFVIPLIIILSTILLGTFVYCLFQRLSRAKAKVLDITTQRRLQEAHLYNGDSFNWSS